MMLIWLLWQSRGAGVSCAGGAGRNGQSPAVTELPLLFLYVQPKAKPTQPLCQNSFTKCRQRLWPKTMPTSITELRFLARSGAALTFLFSWMKLDKRQGRLLPERVRDTIVLIECSKPAGCLVAWLGRLSAPSLPDVRALHPGHDPLGILMELSDPLPPAHADTANMGLRRLRENQDSPSCTE